MQFKRERERERVRVRVREGENRVFFLHPMSSYATDHAMDKNSCSDQFHE
jgi:hypothetical protein